LTSAFGRWRHHVEFIEEYGLRGKRKRKENKIATLFFIHFILFYLLLIVFLCVFLLKQRDVLL